jgi:hypothetical protein
MYTCRDCDRPINPASELCPYCGADLTEEPTPGPQTASKKPNLPLVVLRWAVLLTAMWAFLWFVLPERRGNATAQAEARAIELLLETRAALLAYAETQGGSFPPSFEALPRESGQRVRQAAQVALREGYELFYTPGTPNEDGRVTSFALRARASNYGYRNFFTDETGLLRATRENRHPTIQDPPI